MTRLPPPRIDVRSASPIVLAFGRALRSLGRPGMLWHLIWPGLVSAVVWVTIAVFNFGALVDAITGWVLGLGAFGGWIAGSEAASSVLGVFATISAVLVFIPLIYLTATVLVATIALPFMVERVALTEYTELEQRRGGTQWGSVQNSLVATGLFLGGLIVSLPFWLIPGMAFVATLLLTAWLNQRAFGYDALMMHADADELDGLRESRRPAMMMLGGACGLLAYVPLINLLAPAFSGLAFTHYLLDALRRTRTEHGVTILDPEPSQASR